MEALWVLVQSGGVTFALFLFSWLGMSKRVRWGYQFDELAAELARERAERALERASLVLERDRWQELAIDGIRVARQLTASSPNGEQS